MCKEPDEDIPTITLNGPADTTIFLNTGFIDPKATAKDETEGDISDRIAVKSSLNVNKTGIYSLYYSISDKAGNYSSISRIVRVVNQISAKNYPGNYQTKDIAIVPALDTIFYTTTISDATDSNNSIYFKNINNDTTIRIRAFVLDNKITIKPQTYNNIKYFGDGNVDENKIFQLHYFIHHTQDSSKNSEHQTWLTPQ